MFDIIYILLVALAAMFKAISDLCADHYSTSIFSKYNPEFWNKSISWKRKYKKGWQYWDPISDAWHISNGLMAGSWLVAGYFFPSYNLILVVIITTIWFTLVFNTFYNHIFKLKK